MMTFMTRRLGGALLALGVMLGAGAARALSYEFLFTFGSSGSNNGRFANPVGVAVDPTPGDIVVADTSNHRIQVFDSAGAHQLTFGIIDSNDGQFISPQGVAVDPTSGNIVADTFNHRIQVFDSTGAHLTAAPMNPTPLPDAYKRTYIQERFGNHAIAQLYADGARALTLPQKRVAWYLTLAAHAGEPIAYDQLGWNLVAVKRLVEGVYLFGAEPPDGGGRRSSGFQPRLLEYLKKLYGHGGNHDSVTGQKFVPSFTPDELLVAARRAHANGAPFGPPPDDGAALTAWLKSLEKTIFDPSFEPQLTSKTPPPGKDILTASSNTAYGRDVTLADLEGFREKYPLNSRVVKQDGKLVEQPFRAGTLDRKIPPGLYAEQLRRVIAHVEEAAKHASKDQKDALRKLVKYFRTGSPAGWDAYNIAWLRTDPVVDANLGFIERYVDARGQKGQWEGLINYRDEAENPVMALVGKKVQYFEDRMPWPDAYKRKRIKPPVAKAIDFLTAFPTPPGGINLPNEQHIHQQYGSKSVLVSNTMETTAALKRLPLAIEFSRTAEEKESARRYSVLARKWLFALHEVTGHASGQTDKKLEEDPAKYLKEYYNTLEETRADLVALWHAFDPALAELSPDHTRVAEQMYRYFLIEGLTNLHYVEKGDAFEEDHQRGLHMTVNFLREKEAVQEVTEGGRTYWVVTEFPKMRAAVGELLTKLMTIKATGDYAGIRALVEKHGIRFDPKLRDQVVARVKAANVPTVILMTSPRLVPVVDATGAVTDVKVTHDQDFLEQHLERSVLGELPPAEATRAAARLGAADSAEARMRILRELMRGLGGGVAKTAN